MLLSPIDGQEQGRFIKSLIKIINETQGYENFLHHATELGTRQAILEQAEEHREQCIHQEAVARGELQVASTEAQRAYNRAYFSIQLLFDNDKSLVESSFRKLRKPSRNNETDDDSTAGSNDDSTAGSNDNSTTGSDAG